MAKAKSTKGKSPSGPVRQGYYNAVTGKLKAPVQGGKSKK